MIGATCGVRLSLLACFSMEQAKIFALPQILIQNIRPVIEGISSQKVFLYAINIIKIRKFCEFHILGLQFSFGVLL